MDNTIKELAVDVAKRSGQLLAGRLGGALAVEHKGAVDLVTEMDRRAEDLIVGEIRSAFPDHGILTEEREELVTDSRYRWIIDPLDGTTNYAHGYPVFCTSVAFEDSGEVVFGVVYDPMLDELFVGEKGRGATLNGARIRVSEEAKLDNSLLATGFPYDIRTSKKNNLDHFGNFAVRAQAIRRAGSAALDLCYVACSRFDGFWEMKLRPWDVAAAVLMITEAGGRVTDFGALTFSIDGKECLATNGLIHDPMLEVLSPGSAGAD